MSKVTQGHIYPAKKGRGKVDGYDFFLCCVTGDFYLVDCLPVGARGNAAPGYEVGVPVQTSDFYVTRGKKLED